MADLNSPFSEVEILGRVSVADHRLESHDELGLLNGPPSSLFLNLPGGGSRRIFGLIDVTAGQLPHPPVNDEPMPPHQQHPVLVIDPNRRGRPANALDVLLELGSIGQPDRRDAQPDERVLITQPLTVDLPLRTLTALTSHSPDGTWRHCLPVCLVNGVKDQTKPP